MRTRIQHRPAFKAAGVKGEGITSKDCPAVWDKLYDQGSFIQLELMGNGQSYGICYGETEDEKINYMAAYNMVDERKAMELGLDVLEVPEADYLVVTLKGPVPQSIHEGWHFVMEVYFPEQGYRHAGTPDFELYSQGDIKSKDYQMELWVPFVKQSGKTD